MDELERAAAAIARLLRDEPWYHRTTMQEGLSRACPRRLTVWGEGERPASLPETFRGIPVGYNRVSRRHPCPFGSVKADFLEQ
jgi:hypothetical protein